MATTGGLPHLPGHRLQDPPAGGPADEVERRHGGGVLPHRRPVRPGGGPDPLAGRAPAGAGALLPGAHRPRTGRADRLDHLLRGRAPLLRRRRAAELPIGDADRGLGRLLADAGRRRGRQRGGAAGRFERHVHLLRAHAGLARLLPGHHPVRGGSADRLLRLLRYPGDRPPGADLRGLGPPGHVRRHRGGDHRRLHDRLGGHHPDPDAPVVGGLRQHHRFADVQGGVVGHGAFVPADQRRRPHRRLVRHRRHPVRRQAPVGEGSAARRSCSTCCSCRSPQPTTCWWNRASAPSSRSSTPVMPSTWPCWGA